MHTPVSFALGTPYTRVGASEGYIQSLADWCSAHPAAPFKVQGGASYGKNRNVIVDWFLRSRREWLLQLDDDIRFPANILAQLSKYTPEAARVVVGAVPISAAQPSNVFAHPLGLAEEPVTMASAGAPVATVVGFGGAILLVHRSVYVEVAERFGYSSWFTTWQENVEADGLTVVRELEPDLSFARRLRECGIEAWARFGIPLTHCKPTELRVSA